MQYPQQGGLEVGKSAVWIDQLRLSEQRHGHRVDGEVATRQILIEPRGLDLGQVPGEE